MPLTDRAIKTAKAKEKDYKLSDEKGLFLLATKTGSKLFKLKYRFHSKEKKLSLGAYPDTSLKDAREKRDAARKLLTNGICLKFVGIPQVQTRINLRPRKCVGFKQPQKVFEEL